MPPRYNVDVKRATYKPMEVDIALARSFARETDDIATALTGFLTAEI